jgi:polyvinyl alcohol dehydrogenase (cytochrome)
VWKTKAGPGGHLGGIHWGTAYDGTRLYLGVNDTDGSSYALQGGGSQSGQSVTTGSWGALDPTSGDVLWQIANPALSKPLSGASVNGPVTVVGGVLFDGSMDSQGTMYALDASSGAVLWSFASGGTVYGGPAVAGGVVYWGAGYPLGRLGFGTSAKKLYAFAPR